MDGTTPPESTPAPQPTVRSGQRGSATRKNLRKAAFQRAKALISQADKRAQRSAAPTRHIQDPLPGQAMLATPKQPTPQGTATADTAQGSSAHLPPTPRGAADPAATCSSSHAPCHHPDQPPPAKRQRQDPNTVPSRGGQFIQQPQGKPKRQSSATFPLPPVGPSKWYLASLVPQQTQQTKQHQQQHQLLAVSDQTPPTQTPKPTVHPADAQEGLPSEQHRQPHGRGCDGAARGHVSQGSGGEANQGLASQPGGSGQAGLVRDAPQRESAGQVGDVGQQQGNDVGKQSESGGEKIAAPNVPDPAKSLHGARAAPGQTQASITSTREAGHAIGPPPINSFVVASADGGPLPTSTKSCDDDIKGKRIAVRVDEPPTNVHNETDHVANELPLGGEERQVQVHDQPGDNVQGDRAHVGQSEAQEGDGDGGDQPRPKKRPFVFVYGNYKRYYGYRIGSAFEEDPRLIVMQAEWFKGKRCLDVGCNSGVVTLGLAMKFGPAKMVGVDIDPSLIADACRQLRQIRHATATQLQHHERLGPSAKGQLGTLRQHVSALKKVSFVAENWVTTPPGKRGQFDVVLLLSVTKWIHLHHGDDGLKTTFKKVVHVLAEGGVVVLEPQPWKSYGQAVRKMSKSDVQFHNIQTLDFRPQHFNGYLADSLGLELVQDLQVGTATKGFDRPMQVFRKPVSKPSSAVAP